MNLLDVYQFPIHDTIYKLIKVYRWIISISAAPLIKADIPEFYLFKCNSYLLYLLSSGGREGRVFTLDHAGQRTIEKSNKNSAYNLALFLQLHIE